MYSTKDIVRGLQEFPDSIWHLDELWIGDQFCYLFGMEPKPHGTGIIHWD
jgi:hypothetical protein